MKIEEYSTIKKWFAKKEYAEATKKSDIEHIGVVCNILKETPDELVKNIKESKDVLQALEDQQVKLTFHMKKNMMNRSIAQYFNMLHSFYRSNGIRLTPEVVRRLTDKTQRRSGIRFRAA